MGFIERRENAEKRLKYIFRNGGENFPREITDNRTVKTCLREFESALARLEEILAGSGTV